VLVSIAAVNAMVIATCAIKTAVTTATVTTTPNHLGAKQPLMSAKPLPAGSSRYTYPTALVFYANSAYRPSRVGK